MQDVVVAPQAAPLHLAVDPLRRRRWGALGILLLFAAYLALSCWVFRRLLPFDWRTRSLGTGLLDPGQATWWLNWVPFALGHGLNPFYSHYLLAPQGVNAMQNTSTLTLGVLFAPVTILFGPVAAFNVACVLGSPLSALAAFYWLRRHFRALPAAIGGLIFGFSPFAIDHGNAGHIVLTWLCLVPVIIMLVEDCGWRSPRPWWPQGPVLGLVIFLQLLISEEVLAILAVGCLLGLVMLAIVHWRRIPRRVGPCVAGFGVAGVVGLVLCAYPLSIQFTRHGHFLYDPAERDNFFGNATMLVNPPRTLLFHTRASAIAAVGHLTAIENGLYVGVPLLALLAVTVVISRRRPPVIIAAVVVVVSVTVETAWPHRIPGVIATTPLLAVQARVHVLGSLVPGRFAILMWAAIAFLVAGTTDRLIGSGSRAVAGLGPLAVVACLVPLTPVPLASVAPLAATPTFFTSGADRMLRSGEIVMAAPIATDRDTAAMLWQERSGMRFTQVGGYVVHPNADGSFSEQPYPMLLTELFEEMAGGGPYPMLVTPSLFPEARQELDGTGAGAFLLQVSGAPAYRIFLYRATRLLERPPDAVVGGMAVWHLRPAR